MHKLHLLLQRLADAGVEFVVIGGYAAVFHSVGLVANALAVCAMLSAGNVAKIRVALADLNPMHRQTDQKLSFWNIRRPVMRS
jgi:hypothetical protein